MCFDIVVWMVWRAFDLEKILHQQKVPNRFCGKPLDELAEPGVIFGKVGLLRKNELVAVAAAAAVVVPSLW